MSASASSQRVAVFADGAEVLLSIHAPNMLACDNERASVVLSAESARRVHARAAELLSQRFAVPGEPVPADEADEGASHTLA